MSAYIIGEVDVTDAAAFEQRYRPQVMPTLEKYGGRFVVRGGKAELMEGAVPPKRMVVIQFADMAAAKRWYASPEYQTAIAARKNAAKVRMILVEGVA